MTAILVEGDLLEHDAKYIAHQCNCVSKGASGLARYLFDKYPHADIYKDRVEQLIWHQPGEIYVRGDDTNRRVINMTSQFLPGGPGDSFPIAEGYAATETSEARERLFLRCLKKVREIPDLHSIAFPWRIGCGLAQGDWNRYHAVLDKFAAQLKKQNVDVFIVKKQDNQ